MPRNHVGELAALSTAVLWTLSAVAWTAAGRRVGALAVSFLRLLLAVALLMLYGYLVHGRAVPYGVDLHAWHVLAWSGFLGYCVSDLCQFKAFLLVGPRLALLVVCSLTPPTTVLLSWAWRGEGLGAQAWLGMAITLAGVAWVVLERGEKHEERHAAADLRAGLALALVATVVQSAAMVLRKDGAPYLAADEASLILILGALAGYLVFITFVRRWPAMAAAASKRRPMAIVAAGTIVGPCLGTTVLMVAFQKIHEGVITTILATIPVLILPFSIWLFRERVSLRAAGGAVVAVAGIALLMWR